MALFVRLAPLFVLGLAACSSTPAPAPSAPVVSLAPAATPATTPANTRGTPAPTTAPVTAETTDAPAAGPRAGATKEPFSKGEAMMVLSRVHLADCGQNVRGHIRVVFEPSGQVSTATIDEGPARGSNEGRCVEERFRALRVSEFDGAPITVGKAFSAR